MIRKQMSVLRFKQLITTDLNDKPESVFLIYLSGFAEPAGCKPAEWRGSSGRVSSSPRGSPRPAAGEPAARPR